MMHAAIGSAIANLLLMIFQRKFLFINSFNLAERQKKDLLPSVELGHFKLQTMPLRMSVLMHRPKSE